MDPVALAARAVGAGVSAGVALVGVTVAALSATRPPPGTTEPAAGAPLYVLAAGTLGGLVLASAFATVLVMQIYPLLDATLGAPALLAAAVLAAGTALLLYRRSRRMAAT